MAEMTDVLRGLACCGEDPVCGECPYRDEAEGTCGSLARLHQDAQEMATDMADQLARAWEDNGRLLRQMSRTEGET